MSSAPRPPFEDRDARLASAVADIVLDEAPDAAMSALQAVVALLLVKHDADIEDSLAAFVEVVRDTAQAFELNRRRELTVRLLTNFFAGEPPDQPEIEELVATIFRVARCEEHPA